MTRYTTHGRSWTAQRELARSMRHEPTQAEALLWERLRGKRLGGWKFRRQHPIGRFIVDFYCVELGVVIEVDGPVHDRRVHEDFARQEYLKQRGIRFLRVTNHTVLENIKQVLGDILRTLGAPAPPLHVVERGSGGEVLERR